VNGGCCGLAGSWGFEQGHHDISMQCGEQALLPAVRSASPDTLVIADGFSCKTQIEQAGTGRRALHVAQVMKMAREHGVDGYRAGKPEGPYYEVRPPAPPRLRAARLGGVAAAAGAAVAGATLLTVKRRGGG
jgi:hypothetical protein